MQTFSFSDFNQIDEFFAHPPELAIDALVGAIMEALRKREEEAFLYSFQSPSSPRESYDTSLSKDQWVKALTYSLHYYAELGQADKALDVRELLEALKLEEE